MSTRIYKFLLWSIILFSAAEMIERIKEKCALKELESLGFSSSTISTWKTKNTPPRSDDLLRISQFLGVSMEYLLTGLVKSICNAKNT